MTVWTKLPGTPWHAVVGHSRSTACGKGLRTGFTGRADGREVANDKPAENVCAKCERAVRKGGG